MKYNRKKAGALLCTLGLILRWGQDVRKKFSERGKSRGSRGAHGELCAGMSEYPR